MVALEIPALRPRSAGPEVPAKTITEAAVAPIGGDPDVTLIGIAAALDEAAARLGGFSDAEQCTGEDHPSVPAELDRIDVLLLRAASLTPTSDAGFAAMAQIADRFMGDWRAGEVVARRLLRLTARRA